MEEKLKLYHLQAEKLRKHPEFLQNLKATLNFDEIRGISVTHEGFDDKTIATVFMAFRPFYMKGRIDFEELCNQIILSSPNEEIRGNTQQALDLWNELIKSKSTPKFMRIGNIEIGRRENFLYWMNEEHFHPENYKIDGSRGLSLIKQSEVLEWFSKPNMVGFLQSLVQLVLWLDEKVVIKLLT